MSVRSTNVIIVVVLALLTAYVAAHVAARDMIAAARPYPLSAYKECLPGETPCYGKNEVGNCNRSRPVCCPHDNACCCPDGTHCCKEGEGCECHGICPGVNCSCYGCSRSVGTCILGGA